MIRKIINTTYEDNNTWTAIVSYEEDDNTIYEIELDGYSSEEEAYLDAEDFEV